MLQLITTIRPPRRRRTMNDEERKASTQLPPPPDEPVDSTVPPPGGVPPSELKTNPPDPEAEKEALAVMERERVTPTITDVHNSLLQVHAQQLQMNHDLLDPTGRYALMLEESLNKALTGFALKFEPRVASMERKLAKVEGLYEELKRDYDKRFATLAKEIAELKEQRDSAAAPATEAT